MSARPDGRNSSTVRGHGGEVQTLAPGETVSRCVEILAEKEPS
jgi:hypothetical protein